MECWKNFNSLDDWVKAVSGLQLLQLEISSAQGSCINALMSMNALLGWPRKAINISVYVCMYAYPPYTQSGAVSSPSSANTGSREQLLVKI